MELSRRNVIKGAATAISLSAIPRSLRAAPIEELYHSDTVDHDGLAKKYRSLLLNEARRLKCDYADVRLSYKRDIKVRMINPFRINEMLGLSVRVLKNGYWGFCCTPIWSEKQALLAVSLAHNQAEGNSQGPVREVDLSRYTSEGEKGEWIMPIEVDPFKKNLYEFQDYYRGVQSFISQFPITTDNYGINMDFSVSEIWFGATNGAEQYQRLYSSGGSAGFRILTGSNARFDLETLPLSGKGFELFTGQDLYSQLRDGFDETLEYCKLPSQPVNIGRYTILLPGSGAAHLLGNTIGAAVELDRIMGVESNNGGTSFIQQPNDELGAFRIGPDTMRVDYDRSDPGAVGTRRWDDEGVVCSEGTLVSQGKIQKVFTDRELASALKSPQLEAAGNCIAPDPTIAPAVRPSNMVMANPNRSSVSVQDMIRDIDKGYFFRKSYSALDYQVINGMISGEIYEIVNGRLMSRVMGAGCWFKSTEIWNNVELVGPAGTQQRIAVGMEKGEPSSTDYFSVTAPAIVFKDAAIIDTTRK